MPRQNDVLVQSEGGDRMLSFGAVRVHNGHLQSGRKVVRGCDICTQGLEGAMAPDATFEEKPEVAESDGGDEEDDPALASGGGAYFA